MPLGSSSIGEDRGHHTGTGTSVHDLGAAWKKAWKQEKDMNKI